MRINPWTLRRNRRGPGIKRTFCERLNTWRRLHLFVTAKEHNKAQAELHMHLVAKVDAVSRREHELFLREMRAIRAEVDMNRGQTVTYTFAVSESLLIPRRNGQLDRQICESITRKMIDGLRWAADNKGSFKFQTRQY